MKAPRQRAEISVEATRDAPSALLALLAGGQEHSGSALAAHLGVTRAAVWKQVEHVRALGLPVHALAGRGYRLDAPIELLDAGEIEAAVSPGQRARVGKIEVLWQTDSTNSALARQAMTPAPSACLAEIQTQGRGRRGRSWQLPLAGGIALSYLRRFESGMASLSGLSLVAGIAVIRALADCGVADVARLKWPNDVVVEGRKLAGILVELGGDALGPCHAIVGIGINVRMDSSRGASIDQPWTDLASIVAQRMPTRNRLAGCLLSRLAEVLEQFATDGFAAFEDEYAGCDALNGRRITVESGTASWIGTAKGVTARGALRVERNGVDVEFDSAEVRVRDREAVS